jgi:type II secretory pathway component GspD/PulD (secretin)
VLKDIFKEGDKQRIPLWMQMEYGMGDGSDKDRGRLSKKRPLKIVSEYDTNSILVQGADASQLKTIKELVEFYDKPEPPDAQSVHQTEKFILRWTKADVVAETIKDLYRDLLSPKDRALSGQQQDQQRRPFVISLFDDSSGEGEAQKRPRFQGLLSLGVDKVSNTLIVSAPPYLMKEVSKLIKELDEAAMPSEAVSVVKLGPGVSSQKIQEAVSRAMGNGGTGRPGSGRPGMGQPGQPGEQGNRDRGQPGDQGGRRSRRGG